MSEPKEVLKGIEIGIGNGRKLVMGFQCQLCGKDITDTIATDHRLSEDEVKIYMCNDCHNQFVELQRVATSEGYVFDHESQTITKDGIPPSEETLRRFRLAAGFKE